MTVPSINAPAPAPGEKVTKHRDIDEEHGNVGPKHALVDMSTIELKADDLYDKEKVDLESIELEDVYTLLQATESGLSESEAKRRIDIFGPNKLESEEVNPILQFLSFMWNPLSWVFILWLTSYRIWNTEPESESGISKNAAGLWKVLL